MAYSIVESSANYFITNKMELPRFQRKQTWKEQANFKLCISVFKGYPIGVVIINQIGTQFCLLDGRQRRNALKLMSEDPVEIYRWARVFLKLKPLDNEQVVKDKFYEMIDVYLQNEYNKATEDDVDLEEEEFYDGEFAFDAAIQTENLNTLLDLILLVHGKYKKENTFVGMFKFDGIIPLEDLEYAYPQDGEYKINPVRLKKYVRNVIEDGDTGQEAFKQAVRRRYKLDRSQARKMEQYLDKHWDYFERCFDVIQKADKIVLNAQIGVIKLMNASTLDAQNIFSLVNGEGVSLSAEELLSARPYWNEVIKNPSDAVQYEAGILYKDLNGTIPNNIVRWDLCATLLSRIDSNALIFEQLDVSKSNNFTKKLTLGFKLVSAVYVGGVSSKSITDIEKERIAKIDWETDIENFIRDFGIITSLLESCEYFKYVMAWGQSIMSLTSNTIALEFASLMYKRWGELGRPVKSSTSKVRTFCRDAAVLYDRLVYEYGMRVWSGSSDSKLSNDLKNINERFIPVETEKWLSLIDDMSVGTHHGTPKAVIYHYYCLKKMTPTICSRNTVYELDHIYAQDQFKKSSTVSMDLMNSLGNFALLPKDENISKGNRPVNKLRTETWLYDQVKKYAQISEEEVERYSDICNVQDLVDKRIRLFKEVFQHDRLTMLNNN